MTNLGTKNYRLQLQRGVNTRSVARGVMLMSGNNRVSTLVFAEPEYGQMWIVNIVSKTGQNGLLGDSRKVKKLITSLRFEK